MKVSEAPSKIIGVTLGEANISLLRVQDVPFKAKFALLTKDGNSCGYIEIGEWSDKTIDALKTFIAVIEEEALTKISDGGSSEAPSTSPEKLNEPKQF